MHPHIHAKNNPDKPAFIMANSGEVVTYKELDERSNKIANLFRSKNLNSGDHISIFMENNVRFTEILWAAQRSGLYYTPISSRLTASEVDNNSFVYSAETNDSVLHSISGNVLTLTGEQDFSGIVDLNILQSSLG